ncbi:response regulator [Rhodocytophaga aerolata]|uniref:Response regulator n=1 Tax=Rhodocytophaga aerolata TaxID=455078 RepID=A0ABT8R4K2_9BACT|nr:response regulator [Rhodocytophaga aerolata]MDO1446621.1 response regulator [Rhodocytophaga aerolata]
MEQVEVLLIEDSEYDAELTFKAMKIKMPSVHYQHLRDGQEALDFLHQGDATTYSSKLPLLILLDLDIPKVPGLHVLEQLKRHPLTKRIPVVVLTISKDLEKMRAAYQAGANSYVIKPVSFVKFSLIIAEIVHYWLSVNDYPDYDKLPG